MWWWCPISARRMRLKNSSAQLPAVYFRNLALAADHATFQFLRHRFPEFVGEHESRLVGHAEIAREGEHALALHFVAEDRDGGEVAFERQLVRGEQRAGRD